MSRKPGLGKFMISKLPKVPYILVNGHKKRLPRYYKDLMFTKSEKIEIRKKLEAEAQVQYLKELDYLRSKGYKYPEHEYQARAEYALTIIEKRNEKNNFKRRF